MVSCGGITQPTSATHPNVFCSLARGNWSFFYFLIEHFSVLLANSKMFKTGSVWMCVRQHGQNHTAKQQVALWFSCVFALVPFPRFSLPISFSCFFLFCLLHHSCRSTLFRKPFLTAFTSKKASSKSPTADWPLRRPTDGGQEAPLASCYLC